jgi:hypothetical protein
LACVYPTGANTTRRGGNTVEANWSASAQTLLRLLKVCLVRSPANARKGGASTHLLLKSRPPRVVKGQAERPGAANPTESWARGMGDHTSMRGWKLTEPMSGDGSNQDLNPSSRAFASS